MQQVAIHTLKNSLSAVLEKVCAGEDAIITSHRKPIAKIVALTADTVGHSVGATSNLVASKPMVSGVTWRSGRFVLKDVRPALVKGGGITVVEMLVAQRRGEAL